MTDATANRKVFTIEVGGGPDMSFLDLEPGNVVYHGAPSGGRDVEPMMLIKHLRDCKGAGGAIVIKTFEAVRATADEVAENDALWAEAKARRRAGFDPDMTNIRMINTIIKRSA